MRILLFFLAIATPACSCPGPPPAPPPPPIDVGPASLVRIYRDTPGIAASTYTGRRVRVRLPASGYVVKADGVGWSGVGWLTGFSDAPPALVFFCDPPPDNKSDIEVVGLCAGRSEDGHKRAPDVDWCVVVTECSLLRRAAP